jgi:glycosyltransferase involved in cell wall biosynthesis
MVVQNYYDFDPRVRREAESLANHGYQVDVVSLIGDDKTEKTYHLNGVNVYTIPVQKRRSGKFRYILEYLIFFLFAFVIVSKRMLSKNYCVIQIHTLPDFLIFSALIPKMLGAKIVLDMHEVMPEFYMSKYGVGRQNGFIKLLLLLEKWSVNFADEVIAANDPIAERLESRGLSTDKVNVVMNSADESIFNIHKYPPIVSNSNEKHIKMMYHGTLTNIYGLDIAIRAMELIQKKEPKFVFRFDILGVGPEQEYLTRLTNELNLHEQIRFIGNVHLDDIPDYIANCDVGILPTRSDIFLELSFSNKLVEYVVMRKPIIAASLKGYKRYFREDSLKFFYPGSPDSLAKAILDLAKHRDAWSKMVNNALEDYETIKWDVMSKRYNHLIDGLLE